MRAGAIDRPVRAPPPSFRADVFDPEWAGPLDDCSPVAVHREHPHGRSDSPDCNYDPPYSCEQEFDVGVWFASGAGGQVIVGHRGLDMVLVAKDLGAIAGSAAIWGPARPALVALDPMFQGDEEAFCAAYAANVYAPDLR